jgi:hypothetical protein
MKSLVSWESKGSRLPQGRLCTVVLVAAMAALFVPAGASAAASPVLEFLAPGHSLPVSFTTESGAVSAEMAGFSSLVHCAASHGEGEITGPRSAVSEYRLTGCKTEKGSNVKCKSPSANVEEIKVGPIDAELVYLNRARHEVGMLLNPGGSTYIEFECGGEHAEGKGPFLAPVSPVNQEATSFTATLSQLDSVQTPNAYENEKGELLQAFPIGRRESNEFVPTGVELAMTVHPSVPVEIKAVTAQEIEAKEQEEEAEKQEAALKTQEEALKNVEAHAKQAAEEAKKHEEEANVKLAALGKTRQEEVAAAKVKQEEAEKARAHLERAGSQLPAAAQLTRALRECKKQPKARRARCVARAHKKYGAKATRAPGGR